MCRLLVDTIEGCVETWGDFTWHRDQGMLQAQSVEQRRRVDHHVRICCATGGRGEGLVQTSAQGSRSVRRRVDLGETGVKGRVRLR